MKQQGEIFFMSNGDSIAPHSDGNTREQAWQLLTEWTQSESLRKHALAVEICVTACGEAEADRLGLTGEPRAALLELYSTTALLHDFDYERHPSREEHPFVGVRELERQGWPVELRTAILGHAQYSGVPRVTHLDKCLFACDELAGFLTACALVKPIKVHRRCGDSRGAQEDEGQGLRPRRQPRRRDPRRCRARAWTWTPILGSALRR